MREQEIRLTSNLQQAKNKIKWVATEFVVLVFQRAGASLRWRRSVSYWSRLRSRRAAELTSELGHWSINDIVKLTRQSAVRTVYKLSFCWKSPMIVEICSFKSLILPLNSTLPTEIQERKARGRAPRRGIQQLEADERQSGVWSLPRRIPIWERVRMHQFFSPILLWYGWMKLFK
jgi:hypothetical protein